MLQKTPTIGVVELPDFGLIDPKGENLLSGIRNKDRKGTALISKQVLLSNLQAGGFDAQLINLRDGDYQGEFGKVIWKGTELTKVYLGQKINALDPLAYDAWGVTNNFSQFREIACIIIKHLASKGRPVVVGGSDAIAESQFYFAAGATAVVLDKSGAANAPIMDYVLGKTPREALSGVILANGNQPPPRVRRPL
ncbi:MAG: radical SAM protein, partial [Candidatus Parabeggiatoa sp. nov. 3]